VDYYLFAPNVRDKGLKLNTDEHDDLIKALPPYIGSWTSAQDLYYTSYYELIGEGLIFPDAALLNGYLRDIIKKHGDVILVFGTPTVYEQLVDNSLEWCPPK
jgi:hypothetical protein|tara:strand:- start:257 stop:562 length:306 start_codon:yes stop_codon:yes gene_type:complete